MKTDRELQIASEMRMCKHYTGTHAKTCKAGVNYRQLVGGLDLGWGTRLPCNAGLFPAKNGEPATCEKRETRRREEAETLVDAHTAAIERHMRAIRVAHDDAKAKGFKRGMAARVNASAQVAAVRCAIPSPVITAICTRRAKPPTACGGWNDLEDV